MPNDKLTQLELAQLLKEFQKADEDVTTKPWFRLIFILFIGAIVLISRGHVDPIIGFACIAIVFVAIELNRKEQQMKTLAQVVRKLCETPES